ncbi:MAG: DUF58 domain-containing protein [Pseudomonas sp.]|uniref:DUF58 domain-containing protein n=1 Tax=Halopseudomonas laoshanensis TaxID=2268758 RepID=UPI001B5081F3|nr:DUF58 domain-containing protein [Pseudomonas sp.]MBQ0778025.1 DUF58 domain-containing protein [Pseudomonas sp.]
MKAPVAQSRVYISLDDLLNSRQHCQRLPLFRGPVRASRQLGQQFTRLRGRGVDFDQVRSYQPGDDIRSIDWRVTARSGKVHTKVFNEERERPVFLMCEQSDRMFFGSQTCMKSVLAADAASLIAWTALAHNDRVGGVIFGAECHEVRPQRNRRAILRLFSLLKEANNALQPASKAISDMPSEPLNLALRHSREVVKPGSILYLLCDHAAIDHLNQTLLINLAVHNDLVLLPVYDVMESQLPAQTSLAFMQADDRLTLNTADATLRKAYADQFIAQQQAWQRLSRRFSCSLFSLHTGSSAVDQLRDMLSSHKHRSAQ